MFARWVTMANIFKLEDFIVGSIVRVRSTGNARSINGKLLKGKIGKITHDNGTSCVLDIESSLKRSGLYGGGGVWKDELELISKPLKYIAYNARNMK